ncbi:alginate lyase family protein [Simiduia agarivorans]|uniref:Uncharacterized protein n=1 Tax=Simiduia agarivorans (strain DSM 21679 / JCM 13881 / BCRC 17597 / SA1) TaxID=1117647 RepID=K4KM24_SIMAS|nr:alginate lyase family protein [Simiduia agarivorans]AFU99270.2 hypothetical protein M5M_10445 [Simiduia agarivorans SA1 = DSM 21679]
MRAGVFFSIVVTALILSACESDTDVSRHPNLLVAAQDVAAMKRADGVSAPLFADALQQAQTEVDAAMAQALDIPLPKDPGGGYSHERHKKNALLLFQAGQLYTIKGDPRYANWAAEVLVRYADLYPTLGLHPEHKHQAPGKLFWQILNDAWWLTYVIQAYDMVLPAMTEDQRAQVESRLLRPYADFLSKESASTFNKVHNHGTWAAAAVGMTGLVLADDYYVNIALKGLDQSGKAGFLKQMDQLFSPDGYYTEGPYYQRYALLPFVMFARALDRHKPSMGIFEYRDRILIKAIYAAIQLTDGHYFLPLNDAIKDKGLDTIEMVYGVSIAYAKTQDKNLLAIARKQNQVVLTGDGLRVAVDLARSADVQFPFSSQLFRDGPNGDEGAVALLRAGDTTVVFKAASQGMGHGHFDRLGWQLYSQGAEIVSDYGAARYLNVEPKQGGIYLPENTSWAKQTVAHNALVVDRTSHFDGSVKRASKSSPELLQFVRGEQWQLVSAREANAYKGVVMTRTQILLEHPLLSGPLVLDLLAAESDEQHVYELPVHFQGQLMTFSGELAVNTDALKPLGTQNGYQHLWHKATLAPAAHRPLQASWLSNNRFYTLTAVAPADQTLLVAELGANDPEFNLRRDQALIARAETSGGVQFVQLLEQHGHYDGRAETVSQPRSAIARAAIEQHPGAQVLTLDTVSGQTLRIVLADDRAPERQHALSLGEQRVQWQGPVHLLVNH